MHKVRAVIKSTFLQRRRFTMAAKPEVSDNYMIVDVGANLTNKKFNRDVDSVIQPDRDRLDKNSRMPMSPADPMACKPLSTYMVTPVTHRAKGLHKNAAARPTSIAVSPPSSGEFWAT